MMAGNSRRYGTFSNFTQSPIIGRLRITSSALPIHMLAIRPQNSSGRVVITSGPGWMPWMVSAPSMSAITRGAALDRSLAEARGVLGELLLQHVGRKRRDRRAGARQHTEERAEHGAARD